MKINKIFNEKVRKLSVFSLKRNESMNIIIDKYLNESQKFKVGDFIKQLGSDFVKYGQIVQKYKNKSYKAAVFTSYDGSMTGKAKFESIRGWYPDPKVINKSEIPDKILQKIFQKSGMK